MMSTSDLFHAKYISELRQCRKWKTQTLAFNSMESNFSRDQSLSVGLLFEVHEHCVAFICTGMAFIMGQSVNWSHSSNKTQLIHDSNRCERPDIWYIEYCAFDFYFLLEWKYLGFRLYLKFIALQQTL